MIDINYKLQNEEFNIDEIRIARNHQNELADYILPRANGTEYITHRFENFIKKRLSGEQLTEFCKWIPETQPTSSIVLDEIKPELEKVFDAKDAKISYSKDNQIESEFNAYLKSKKLDNYIKDSIWEELFKAHNSVLIVDLDSETPNTPYFLLIKIKDIVGIKYNKNFDKILEIFYKGENDIYYYISEEYYATFIKEDNTLEIYTQVKEEVKHPLGECPATFIAPLLSDNYNIVRKSFFSNLLPEFDMFNFLSIYTDKIKPYLVSPIITHNSLNTEPCGQTFLDGTHCENGFLYNTDDTIILNSSGQKVSCKVCNANLTVRAGMVIGTPTMTNTTGGLENLNKDFIKFHTPDVNAVKYTDESIEKRRQKIIATIVGIDKQNFSSEAVNEKQVNSSNENKQSVLSQLSKFLSNLHKRGYIWVFRLRTKLYGTNDLDINYGLSFMLDNELSIINRINNINNDENLKQLLTNEYYLYKYGKDSQEFTKVMILEDLHIMSRNLAELKWAFDKGLITREDYLYELNFNSLIKEFENKYGDLISFIGDNYSSKIVEIKEKLYNLIPKQKIIQNETRNQIESSLLRQETTV